MYLEREQAECTSQSFWDESKLIDSSVEKDMNLIEESQKEKHRAKILAEFDDTFL